MSAASVLSFVTTGLLLLAAAAADDVDVCGGNPGQVCQGCNSVVVCALLDGVHATPVATMACSRSAPFCSAGRCVGSMSPDNPCSVGPQPAASTFRCPDGYTGYLPDAADCSRYHYCDGQRAWDYSCDAYPNTVYDHARAACVSQQSAPCYRVQCPANGRRAYTLYAPDNSIAFRCGADGGPTVVLCPANHRLDVLKGAPADGEPSCVRYCSRDGRQAAAADASSSLYYECTYLSSGALSQPVLKACPNETRFDADLERCVLPPGMDES